MLNPDAKSWTPDSGVGDHSGSNAKSLPSAAGAWAQGPPVSTQPKSPVLMPTTKHVPTLFGKPIVTTPSEKDRSTNPQQTPHTESAVPFSFSSVTFSSSMGVEPVGGGQQQMGWGSGDMSQQESSSSLLRAQAPSWMPPTYIQDSTQQQLPLHSNRIFPHAAKQNQQMYYNNLSQQNVYLPTQQQQHDDIVNLCQPPFQQPHDSKQIYHNNNNNIKGSTRELMTEEEERWLEEQVQDLDDEDNAYWLPEQSGDSRGKQDAIPSDEDDMDDEEYAWFMKQAEEADRIRAAQL